MKITTSMFLGAAFMLAVPVALYGNVGCSSSSGGSSSGSGSGSSGGSSSGKSSSGSSSGHSGSSSGTGSSSSSSGSGSSSGADSGLTDADCQGMATGCIKCCQQIHTAGINKLVSIIQACDCGDGGAGGCETTCATEYCKNGMYASQMDACEMCISGSLFAADGGMGVCYTPVVSGCQADTDCNAYLNCTNPQGGSCNP